MTSSYLDKPLRSEAEVRKEAYDRLSEELSDSVLLLRYRWGLNEVLGYALEVRKTAGNTRAFPHYCNIIDICKKALS